MKNQRYEELDSLRGLAAVSVVLHHYLLIFPIFYKDTINNNSLWFVNIFKYSPLHLFFSGTQAVILFFVLSGFVLAIPYVNNNHYKYSIYLIRRITRIYIPYIVSVIFVILVITLFSNKEINDFSTWANGKWSEQIDYKLLIQHFIFVGAFDNGIYNPVYWSLVHEIRISIIFPLIMFMILKYSWKLSLFSSLFISAFGFIGTFFLRKMNIETDYLFSLYFGLTFVFGALLAKYKEIYIKFYNSNSHIVKLSFLGFAIVLYTFPSWVRNLHFIPVRLLDPPNTILSTIGAAMFIIVVLSSRRIKRILLFKPIHFIGKISYSLYLYHCIPLFALLHQFDGILSIWVILIISLIIAVLLAVISYHLVEKPAISLGRRISHKITQNNTIKKQVA